MPADLKVLYIVIINATTSVPLEAAGKMEEICSGYGVQLAVAAYYRQNNKSLQSNFVKDLIELDFKKSFSISTISRYYSLIKTVKPDILHLHHGVSAFQGAILAKLAGVKMVIKTEHNDHKHYKWYQKILTVPVFLFADKIICNSKNTLRSFYPWEKLIAGKKSKVIYNGININHISAFNTPGNTAAVREKYEVGLSDKLFVSVGRLIPQKNYENLLAGFMEAYKTNRQIKLVIAGGGPLEKKLIKIVEDNGLSGCVKIEGMVQRDEVYKIINAADFFIIASRWEGFCNAVAEAMAAGKPVISSNIATLQEVVGEDTGIFFDPLYPSGIANAINSLLSLPEEVIKRMSLTSKDRAVKNFSIEACAHSYLKEYIISSK